MFKVNKLSVIHQWYFYFPDIFKCTERSELRDGALKKSRYKHREAGAYYQCLMTEEERAN